MNNNKKETIYSDVAYFNGWKRVIERRKRDDSSYEYRMHVFDSNGEYQYSTDWDKDKPY